MYSVLMVLVVELIYLGMIQFLSVSNKLEALIILVVCAVVGGLFYGYLSLRSGLAEKYLGSRVARLSRKVGRA
jgi:hypothetical protein